MDDNKNLPSTNTLVKSFQQLSTFQEMKTFAEELVTMDSKLVPFKKAGDVLIVLQAAKDFGIPITFALANIHPIQGKASAGIHLMAAQILNAGITYRIIKDYAPVYSYIGQGSIPVTEEEIEANPDDFHIIGVKTEKEDYHPTKLNVIKQNKIIDRVTIIEFTRWIKQPNGEFTKMVIQGKFSLSDAHAAGLIQSKPDTWGKYPRPMVYARAFADGSHKIGDDVLLGMTETSMMCDVYNIPYSVDESGRVSPNLKKAGITKSDVEAIDAEIDEIE